ncbi:MAG TPA: VOC family protein [Gemmatimonadaceae bacterium]|nr:VOC family protein [Gemmatimonadaceae bacterium]
MATLHRVVLPVSNIERATSFYRAMLSTEGTRISPGRHAFSCGGASVVCYDPRAEGGVMDAAPNAEHVYFAVADLDAAFARARAAGCREIESQVRTRTNGERSFYARDPFGNPICFVDAKTAASAE